MERKIENSLIAWKNKSHRKPLLLQGARQVGKTYSLLNFGKQHFKNVVYLNFESNNELQRIFDRDLSPERIINEISVFSSESILERDSLIIFDEIQACEKALTSLKYFSEEKPEYHIAAAGSLLGIAINRETYSFPVGKVEFMNMFPMDFEEYLWALGQKRAVSIIRDSFENDKECSLHRTFLDYYKKYLFTGGMPQVVNQYAETADVNFIVAIQKNINDSYIADMAKYASAAETVKIMAAYNSIPAQLAKENRKFQYKTIKSGARANQYETSLDWLKASGIIHKCNKIEKGIFPLKSWEAQSSFKVYLGDTGLLCSKYGISYSAMRSEIRGFEHIKGVLTENYVAINLVSNGYIPYYWESQGKAEVDFIIQENTGNIIPIEVKSSENVRSKSLNQYIKTYNPPYSIRISTRNFGFENNIKSLPLYAAFCV